MAVGLLSCLKHCFLKLQFNRKISLRVTLICILLLFIPTITSMAVGYTASKSEAESIIQQNTALLKQVSNTMDERLKELQNMARSIASNKEFIAFSTQSNISKKQTIYDAWKVQQQLKNYCSAGVSSRISVYFSASGALISNDFVYGGETYYPDLFQIGELSFAQWQDMMESDQVRYGLFLPSVVTSGKVSSSISNPSLLYMSSPLGITSAKCRMVILIEMKQELVDSTLSGIDLYQTGSAYILDQNLQLISSRGVTMITESSLQDLEESEVQSIKIQKDDYTVIRLQSQYGWEYIIFLPTDEMLANMQRMTRIMVEIVLSTLILSLISAFFFFRRYFNPIENTVNTLSQYYHGNGQIRKPFLYINESVKALTNDNIQMRQTLEMNHLQFYRVCMDILLHGQADGHEAQIKRIGLSGRFYSVCIICLNQRDTQTSLPFQGLELDALQAKFNGQIFQADITPQFLVTILSFNCATMADCMAEAESWFKTQTARFPKLKQDIFACFGSICDQLSELSWSYEEAKTLHHMVLSEQHGDIFWYSRMVSPSNLYFYNVELEQRLINNVSMGNLTETERILNKVYRDNYVVNTLTAEMSRELLTELRGTLFKLNRSGNDRSLLGYEDTKEAFFRLKVIFLELCSQNSLRSEKNRTEDLGTRMRQYVKENHTDSRLSLSMLAQEFGLTDSYVSKYFKACTGSNFYMFLESCRVEHAVRLMAEKKYRVCEISALVGYANDKSFRRAFKRLKGVAPTQSYAGEPQDDALAEEH